MTIDGGKNLTSNPRRMILAALGLGVLLVAVGWLTMRTGESTGESPFSDAFVTQFFRSYLVAWFYWWAIALGSLVLLLLHNLTGGAWGWAIRDILLAAASTLPLIALLFAPIPLFGLERLYEWADEALVMSDPILAHKAPYLNPAWFVIRAGVYWIVWLAALFFVRRMSNAPAAHNERDARRIRVTSGIMLGLCGLAVTFASFDYGMSLEPHWYSTIYGVLFFVGNGLAAMAFAITALVHWPRADRTAVSVTALHDLGKMLFAFTMIWAYISFSQFLIIWYGNLPEEIPWYIRRTSHGWQFAAIAIALFQFVFPFLILLSRKIKREPRPLATVALWILAIRLLDLIWLVEPAFERTGTFIPWLDVGLTALIGALWLCVFVWQRTTIENVSPIEHERGVAAR